MTRRSCAASTSANARPAYTSRSDPAAGCAGSPYPNQSCASDHNNPVRSWHGSGLRCRTRPLPAIEQYRAERTRLVGHDPVHPEIEQLAHAGFIVHGPDVDGQPGTMGSFHKPRSHEVEVAPSGGHLNAVGV